MKTNRSHGQVAGVKSFTDHLPALLVALSCVSTHTISNMFNVRQKAGSKLTENKAKNESMSYTQNSTYNTCIELGIEYMYVLCRLIIDLKENFFTLSEISNPRSASYQCNKFVSLNAVTGMTGEVLILQFAMMRRYDFYY